MKRYKGGCAIMLKLDGASEPLKTLTDAAAKAWSNADPGWEIVDPQDHHLTLQFVGRDLSSHDAALVIVAAFAFAEESVPITIDFTGQLELFTTGKGHYIVAPANAHTLRIAKNAVVEQLQAVGVKPGDAFPFKPHVTLAEAPLKKDWKMLPVAIEPFKLTCQSLTVKYGQYRMTVEL